MLDSLSGHYLKIEGFTYLKETRFVYEKLCW